MQAALPPECLHVDVFDRIPQEPRAFIADIEHFLEIAPFDLPEAESELVAGYAVEYSSTPYMMMFMAEYVAILTMCALMTILFLGGWLPPVDVAPFNWIPPFFWFWIKTLFIFFLIAMVKAFVPRYRYDQLMRLGWKVFLPISLFWVVLTAGVLVGFDLLPA